MTHYLRFPNEATGMTALMAAGFTTIDSDGNTAIAVASHDHALDIIGSIIVGGKWNSETGEVIIPPTLLDGWHCNYIGELPAKWESYVVTPEQPIRVFAGT